MPSGSKKRKSTKRKSKSTSSPPHQHQGWIRSHLQMLKAPSFGNGGNSKELPQEEANCQGKTEVVVEKNQSVKKGGEAATKIAMVGSENGEGKVAVMATVEFPSMGDDSQNEGKKNETSEDLNMSGSSKTPKELGPDINDGLADEEVKGELAELAGLEGESREGKDSKEINLEKCLEETITSPGEVYVSVTQEGIEMAQAAAEKAEVSPVREVNASSNEAPDDDMSPKVEIAHPPIMAVRRASVWNCCGLFEVFMSSQR